MLHSGKVWVYNGIHSRSDTNEAHPRIPLAGRTMVLQNSVVFLVELSCVSWTDSRLPLLAVRSAFALLSRCFRERSVQGHDRKGEQRCRR